jgi:uncharacterized membrane protein YqjE
VAEQVNQAIAADGHQPGTSLGDLVRDATEQMSTLVRAEVELAKLELAATAKRAGMGGALFGAAAAVVLAALPFLFVSLAEGLVEIFNGWRWAAYLIVFVLFLLVGGILALIGRSSLRKMTMPERTITTVREIPQVIKRSVES